MIKNVIFDLGGVIYTFRPKEYLLKLGYNEAQVDLLVKRMFSGLWLEYDRGTYNRSSLIAKLCSDFPDMEKDFQQILGDDFVDNLINVMPPNLEFFYEVKQRGFKIYILTNFFEDGFAHCRKRDDFFDDADGIVVSAHEGLVKPEPAIYQVLLERYGLAPEDSLFIDDNEQNVEAAKALGIYGIHFTSLEDCKKQFEDLLRRVEISTHIQ